MAFRRTQATEAEIRAALTNPYQGLYNQNAFTQGATPPNVVDRDSSIVPTTSEYQLNQLLKTHIDPAADIPVSGFSLQNFDKEISQNLLKLKTASDPLGQMAKKIAELIQFRNNFIQTLEGTSKRYQAVYMMTKAEANAQALKYLGPAMQEEIKMINSLYPGLGTDKELTVENVGKLVNLSYMK